MGAGDSSNPNLSFPTSGLARARLYCVRGWVRRSGPV